MNSLRHIIDEIKAKADIVAVIGRYVELKKSGRGYSGCCPFHKDTHPSFFVFPETGSWRCFGCGCGGDLIDFLIKMEGKTFWEVLNELAAQAGVTIRPPTPEEQKAIDETRITDDIRGETVAVYQKSLTPELEQRLAAERRWTPETIRERRIVYANGGLAKHLLEICGFPLDLCLRSGVLHRSENGEVRDYFYRRYIFPNIRRGKVVHLSGRAVSGDPKWLHMPGEIEYLYNEDALFNPEVYFGEGIPDGITAEQCGIPAVAIYGKTFKSEWADKFSRCEKVYVGIHLHEPGGPEKAIQIAEALGDKARIVAIPGEQDLNDYMKERTQEDFSRLLAAALDGIRYELSLIPETLDKVELAQRIKPLLEKISRRDDAAVEAYLTVIHGRFKGAGLTKDDIKAYRKLISQYRKKESKDSDGMIVSQEIVWKDLFIINPAQDFIDGKAYFTIYLPVRIGPLLIRCPHVITSDHEIIYLDPQKPHELQRRGLRLKSKDQTPADLARWSLEEDIPNSIHTFINGTATVDPVALFDGIQGLFRTYLDYPDERYHVFMSLWCIGTYFFMLFESYPYIFLNATKRAGKTRTIEIAAPICFNSVMAASVSDAALYRSIETDRCTFFCDEAKKFKSENPKDLSDRLEIVNSGYKKSGSVRRCVGDNHVPQDFSTYSPKLLANVEGLEQTTEDRTMVLRLLRSRRRIPKFNSKSLAPIFQGLRNDLYVLAMLHHQEIFEIYSKLEGDELLKDREEELWGPILAIAEFIDRCRLESTMGIEKEESLTERMRSLALDCQQRKVEDDEDENAEQRILRWVIEFIKDPDYNPRRDDAGNTTEFYSSDVLLAFIRDQEGLDWVTKHYLGRVLKKLQIVKDKCDRPYMHEGTGARKTVLYYRLSRRVIEDIATRYGLGDMVAGFLESEIKPAETRPESQQPELVEKQWDIPF